MFIKHRLYNTHRRSPRALRLSKVSEKTLYTASQCGPPPLCSASKLLCYSGSDFGTSGEDNDTLVLQAVSAPRHSWQAHSHSSLISLPTGFSHCHEPTLPVKLRAEASLTFQSRFHVCLVPPSLRCKRYKPIVDSPILLTTATSRRLGSHG